MKDQDQTHAMMMDLGARARAGGEVARICSELVFGYNQHPRWTEETTAACYGAGSLAQQPEKVRETLHRFGLLCFFHADPAIVYFGRET